MRTFQQISTIRPYVQNAKSEGKTIGFVPTMGALHDGHLSLIRRAKAECDVVIVSVFVNPTQFGPNEDYAKYPRDLNRDSALAQQAGADALFAPAPEVIYPAGDQTFVEVPGIEKRWEGEIRPIHFRGVATVCTKLFLIISPNRAYFGQKDYQQLKVIERLVADLHLPLTIVPCAIVREPDGLAMSSRNAYLSPEHRAAATAINRGLQAAVKMFSEGERTVSTLENAISSVISSEPAFTIDYAVVVDADTLEPIAEIAHRAVALVAARIGSTRLIDNVVLGAPEKNSKSK